MLSCARLSSVPAYDSTVFSRFCVVDARAVVAPQQLQEMIKQTAGRAVDEFSRRSWASSFAKDPDSIALDSAEGFVLYARSVSGCSRSASWMD